MPKLTVLGLDGVNWKIIRHAIDKGRMPYLESILEDGARADMETIQPPLTGPAWTSIMTGDNPGMHGVFGFVNQLTREPYSSKDVKSETIYKAISEAGGDVSVVNLPISYPPDFSGDFVGSFMSPEESFFQPEALSEKFDFSDYKKRLTGVEKSTRVINASKKTVESKMKLANELMDDQDFFFMLFSAPDWVMHNHYHLMEQGEKERAFEIFEKIDRTIKIADERSDNLILMSDHGFESFKTTFHVNQLLKDRGMLETSGSMDIKWVDSQILETGIRAVATTSPLRKLARKTFLTSESLIPLSENVKVRIAGMLSEGIDMKNSEAFCPSSDMRGIYINDERFENVVEDREEKIDQVIEAMPDEIKLHRTENLYKGELDAAPDVIIEEEDSRVSRAIYGDVFYDRQVNHHGKYGFFYAKGENFDSSAELEDLKITQLAPTVAELFNLDFDSDASAIGIVDSTREISVDSELLPDDF